MIREIIKYVTSDGREWSNRADAENHESWLIPVRAVLKLIKCPVPLGHGEYYQLDEESYFYALEQATDLIVESNVVSTINSKYTRGLIRVDLQVGPLSLLQRILSDTTHPVGAFSVFMRIGDDGKIYDQPYFRMHPEEAKAVTA